MCMHIDRDRTKKMKNDPEFYNNIDVRALDGQRQSEKEEQERKKDLKRQKYFRQNNLPAALEKINKLNDPEIIRRRIALVRRSQKICYI